MPIPIARVHCRDQIYSPFSGLPADGEDGPNKKDPTLLFIYYADPGVYAYVSQRLRDSMDDDIEYIDVDTLHTHIDLETGLVLEVMTDMDGANYYGFAPVGE